jgi:hypothetical protein
MAIHRGVSWLFGDTPFHGLRVGSRMARQNEVLNLGKEGIQANLDQTA